MVKSRDIVGSILGTEFVRCFCAKHFIWRWGTDRIISVPDNMFSDILLVSAILKVYALFFLSQYAASTSKILNAVTLEVPKLYIHHEDLKEYEQYVNKGVR